MLGVTRASASLCNTLERFENHVLSLGYSTFYILESAAHQVLRSVPTYA